MTNPADQAARMVAVRAEALFSSREMLCSEAILAALNEAFSGGLSREQVLALASAFPEGLGQAGCLCGAVSGASLGLGLHLAGAVSRAGVRKTSRDFHDAFKEAFGSTCCRVLCKKVQADPAAHFAQCATITARAGELAARMILARRPELADRPDLQALGRRPSVLGSLLRRLADRIG